MNPRNFFGCILSHVNEFATLAILILLRVKPVSPIVMITQNGQFERNQGDSIQLICSFSEAEYDLFRKPVLWKKAQFNTVERIHIMGNINPPFLETGRYGVQWENTSPDFTLRLHITDLQPEDSGNYTCEVRGERSGILASVVQTLSVVSPVEQILITRERNLSAFPSHMESPHTLTLSENSSSVLRCIAYGGYPLPRIDMSIGKKNISDQFSYRHIASVSGVSGLQQITYLSERVTDSFIPSKDYDSRKLRCTVTVATTLKEVESIKLNIEYPPIITCQDRRAFVGDINVILSCEIVSNPEIDNDRWTKIGNNTTLVGNSRRPSPGEQDKHGKTILVFLTIKQVGVETFGTYRISVKNSIGSSFKDVTLRSRSRQVQGTSPGGATDGMKQVGSKQSPPEERRPYPYNSATRSNVQNTQTLAFVLSLISMLGYVIY